MAEVFNPLTTANLNNQQSITAAIDSNFATLKTLLLDILSRSAVSPNQMVAALDMNSNRILNLPAPSALTDPVRLQDVTTPTQISILTVASNVSPNTVYAGPASGGVGFPAFRSLVSADLPVLTTINGVSYPAAPYVVGDLLYANTSTSLARLADVATGSILVSGGVGAPPLWSTTLTLNTISLTPAVNTLTQALIINQTLPSSGSQTGPFSGNIITVTNPGYILTGVGTDSFGLLQANLAAFRVNFSVNENNAGPNYAGLFSLNTTVSPIGENIGLMGSAYNGLVGAGGNLYGMIAVAQNAVGSTNNGLFGINIEILSFGTVADRRFGIGLSSQGTTQGANIDTCLYVAASNASPGWQHFMTMTTDAGGFGLTPFATNATLFNADTQGGATYQIGSFVNYSNVFVAGSVWLSNHLVIPGAVSAAFTSPPRSAGFIQYGSQVSGGAGIQVSNFTGPAYFIGNRADTSSTAPSAVQQDEPIVGFTANPYDGTNYTEIGAIAIKAAQTLTNTHHGSYISFFTTALNSGSETEAVRIGPIGLTLFTAPAAPTGNGIATLGSSSANGLFLDGQGSTNDVTIANKNQNPVLTIATGTTNVVIVGNLTVPTVFGGSAVGSTATLNGTSNGSPSAAYVFVQTNGQFTTFGGTLTPQALITATMNAGTPSQNPIAGTNLWIVGKDGSNTNAIVMDQYGGAAGFPNRLIFRQGTGTAASPTATALNNVLGAFDFYGYTGSVFYRGAAMVSTATEAYSGTAGGTDIEWFTTPNTTHSLTQAVVFRASGGLAIGNTSSDPGANNILLNPQTFSSLAAASSNLKGAVACVSDSTTVTWGATITGGGGNVVMAFCDGAAWTVMGK